MPKFSSKKANWRSFSQSMTLHAFSQREAIGSFHSTPNPTALNASPISLGQVCLYEDQKNQTVEKGFENMVFDTYVQV
ncbi:hypothetical protein V6N11_001503 [Hibiscus sabdariffa]|uniref:Uncharacterized protein n=1 Tax=Hibiscus sabdariffa TaxID=183260 RepID=A0ABR2S0I9_9ROSI